MSRESIYMFHSFFMGIYMTFVYDLIRIFRRICPHTMFFISFEDFMFWIYCGKEVFLLTLRDGNGTLRWFAVAGALFGIWIYKRLISSFFVNRTALLINWILCPIKKAVGWLLSSIKRLTFPRKMLRMMTRMNPKRKDRKAYGLSYGAKKKK